MSAQLRFLDTDQMTVITTKNGGNVDSPGSSSSFRLFVQNFGSSSAISTTLGIEQVGTNDGDDYALIASDSGGAPLAFGSTSLSFGGIAVLQSVPFWVKVTLPAGLTADANPRRFNLRAKCKTT